MNSPNGRASRTQVHMFYINLSYIIKAGKNTKFKLYINVMERDLDQFSKYMIEIYKIQGKLPPF
ncbi:hypothetical protein [Klebsiella phage phiKp_21]|nr:hypothetical protein [Klebsiella phage phiKp_21]